MGSVLKSETLSYVDDGPSVVRQADNRQSQLGAQSVLGSVPALTEILTYATHSASWHVYPSCIMHHLWSH